MSIFLSRGEKSFDKCQLKSVQFTEVVYTGTKQDATIEKTSAEITSHGSAGVRPRLECPTTVDMGGIPIYTDKQGTKLGYDSKFEGLWNLRMVAGAIACSSCKYAGKSPVEVADMRAELAIAEARALIEQANLQHLRDRIANGEDIVADLPANGTTYRPAIEQ